MTNDLDNAPWYHGITRYQWLVLLIASLGWIFDVFEGQIFVASMNEAMPSLVAEDIPDVIGNNLDDVSKADREANASAAIAKWQGRIDLYNNIAFAAFLLGGALGGIVFGTLSDRIGRKRTMSYTILFYSLFTCVTAFAQTPLQMVILRFFVAMLA